MLTKLIRFQNYKLEKPTKFKSDTKVDQTMVLLQNALTI